MPKNASRFALTTVLALFIAGAASAQSTGTGTTGGATTATTKPDTPAAADATAKPSDQSAKAAKDMQLKRGDVAFLKQAAQNGLAEVESSKLAVAKASNTQVKSFAQQMVDDHGKAHEELKALAAAKGVELPTEPSVAQKAKMKVLSTADGASFDRRYAESMGVAAHEDTVKLFQKASTSATDPEIKAFAAKTLPTLQHHLQMAKDMKAAADKEGKASASGTTKP